MNNPTNFDIIIIGGSFAGLSAAMALGRAMRKVLVIDSGKPCNAVTPHAHNLLTHDGEQPGTIALQAKEEVSKYPTVQFYDGLAVNAVKSSTGFTITTLEGKEFTAEKIVLATGLKDVMPDIEGFAECWGKSILHCPYCHGYEVRNEATGIMLNGAMAYEMTKMISNWTKNLTLFTNGTATLTAEQVQKLEEKNIKIIETAIANMQHEGGMLQAIVLKDGSSVSLKALYAKPAFEQHSDIAAKLGCAFTEQGLLEVDFMQKTTVPGVYACGDNANMFRSLAMSIACGSVAGAIANRELIEETF